jgi:hypothetical protein
VFHDYYHASQELSHAALAVIAREEEISDRGVERIDAPLARSVNHAVREGSRHLSSRTILQT